MVTLNTLKTTKEGIRTTVPLRVIVLHANEPRSYKNAQDRNMTVVEGVIADKAGYKKISVYNRVAFPFLKKDKALMLINYVAKPTEIVATTDTKVVMTSTIEVPETVKNTAATEIAKLTGDFKVVALKISEVEKAQDGTIFDTIGQVTEVGDAITVKNRWGSEVKVRNGFLGDETSGIQFAFWRQLSDFPLKVGDVVKVTKGVRSTTTDGAPKITGGTNTSLELLPGHQIQHVVTAPETFQEEGTIIGVSHINSYLCCPSNLCYKKKLVDDVCPTCNTTYKDMEAKHSVVCSVMVEHNEELEELTLFESQVEQVIPNTPEKLKDNSFEDHLVNKLPINIAYTKSPKKDSTVAAFRMN